jgi:transcriptional regulator with GAF, ATPase, and Fis domain
VPPLEDAAAPGRDGSGRPVVPSPTAFAELAVDIHAEGTVEETLERILECALSAVQCAYAGVAMLRSKGRVETVATTDPLVAGLDQLQRSLGQGPDLDLVSDRLGVRVDDMRAEQRWPVWAERVARTGVRSLLGIRLYTETRTVGTLNLYDLAPDHFDIDDEAVAHVMARHAAAALSRASETENLWHAIDARKRIGQAQGILMERFGLDEDQAFQVLLRYSQNNNVKLRAVAEELIRTRRLPVDARPAAGGPVR